MKIRMNESRFNREILHTVPSPVDVLNTYTHDGLKHYVVRWNACDAVDTIVVVPDVQGDYFTIDAQSRADYANTHKTEPLDPWKAEQIDDLADSPVYA